jgi:hypothetical protein
LLTNDSDKDNLESNLLTNDSDKDNLESNLLTNDSDKDNLESNLLTNDSDKDNLESDLLTNDSDKNNLESNLPANGSDKDNIDSNLLTNAEGLKDPSESLCESIRSTCQPHGAALRILVRAWTKYPVLFTGRRSGDQHRLYFGVEQPGTMSQYWYNRVLEKHVPIS